MKNGKISYQEQEPSIKAVFLAKYGSLAIYDEDLKKIFIVDHEQLQFDKTDGWDLIGIPEK